MTDLVVSFPEIESAAGCSLSLVFDLAVRTWPVELVATRSSAFTVDPYISIEGRPIAGVPTVTTGFATKMRASDPSFDLIPQLTYGKDFEVANFNSATDTWVGSKGAYLATPGAVKKTKTRFRVGPDSRYEDSVELDNGGYMWAGTPKVAESGWVFVGSFTKPSDNYYPIVSYSEVSTGALSSSPAANRTLSLYRMGDRLVVTVDNYPTIIQMYVEGPDELKVIGLWVSDVTHKITLTTVSSHGRTSSSSGAFFRSSKLIGTGNTYIGGGAEATVGYASARIIRAFNTSALSEFTQAVYDLSDGYLAV